MSGQLLELMIFAGVAFFVINKLIATLGSNAAEDDLDLDVSKSLLKKNARGARDVTNSRERVATSKPQVPVKDELILKDISVLGNEKEILKGLKHVLVRLPDFSIGEFHRNAKRAFQVIITSGAACDYSQLKELIDKRYIEYFKGISANYGKYSHDNIEPRAKISEIYMFGNNVFIKILFTGKNLTTTIVDMHEEWTFTKSILDTNPIWYLTDIDKIT